MWYNLDARNWQEVSDIKNFWNTGHPEHKTAAISSIVLRYNGANEEHQRIRDRLTRCGPSQPNKFLNLAMHYLYVKQLGYYYH